MVRRLSTGEAEAALALSATSRQRINLATVGESEGDRRDEGGGDNAAGVVAQTMLRRLSTGEAEAALALSATPRQRINLVTVAESEGDRREEGGGDSAAGVGANCRPSATASELHCYPSPMADMEKDEAASVATERSSKNELANISQSRVRGDSSSRGDGVGKGESMPSLPLSNDIPSSEESRHGSETEEGDSQLKSFEQGSATYHSKNQAETDDDGGDSSSSESKIIRPQQLNTVELITGSHEADDEPGGGTAEARSAAWESAWGELDEERDFPDHAHLPDQHGMNKEDKERSKYLNKPPPRSLHSFFGQYAVRACSERNRKLLKHVGLVAMFVVASVLLVISLAMDTKDAVDELETIVETKAGGTDGERNGLSPAAADQQDELEENCESGEPSGEGTNGSVAVSATPPIPPSNLVGLCSSPSGRNECRTKCSQAECCFAPWWYFKTCRNAEGCCTYVEACSRLEMKKGENKEKSDE